MSSLNPVQDHYTTVGVEDRFSKAIDEISSDGSADWSKFTPIDQFHARGLEATKEVAQALDPKEGEAVLDVGCGLGGPARYLAATTRCHVTGIDLTPAYIDIAKTISQKTGLSDRLTFIAGDALKLPFDPETFDRAWTLHVAMNIEDKEGLYNEIYRVLKPGGRFVVYDFFAGNGEPLIFPVPWASIPEISFVVSPDRALGLLNNAGFDEVSSVDTSKETIKWFAEMRAAAEMPDSQPQFNLSTILGPDAQKSTRNALQNLIDGRLRLVQIVVSK